MKNRWMVSLFAMFLLVGAGLACDKNKTAKAADAGHCAGKTEAVKAAMVDGAHCDKTKATKAAMKDGASCDKSKAVKAADAGHCSGKGKAVKAAMAKDSGEKACCQAGTKVAEVTDAPAATEGGK